MIIHETPPKGRVVKGDTEDPGQAAQEYAKQGIRSRILRYRLKYAQRGVLTSLADVTKKKPVLKNWQGLATTDPRRIHAEYNNRRLPEYDGVLMPTGRKYGRWAFDVDSREDLERLENKLGVQLRGISTEVTTQSNHWQIHFLWPQDDEELRGSVGKNASDGFPGLDIRAEGNQVLLPPSVGYSFANDLPPIHAPAALVEWVRARTKKRHSQPHASSKRGGAPESVSPIYEGSRHLELARRLGRCHDGTRSLEELTEIALEINARDCVPPIGSAGDDDPIKDVYKIAHSIHKKPPCRPARERDAEIEALFKECSDYWFAQHLTGGGRSKSRDIYQTCLDSAGKRRQLHTIRLDGEERVGLVFSDSYRQIAEAARTSKSSVERTIRQLEESGAITPLSLGEGDRATTWLLLAPPAHYRDTPQQPPSLAKGRLIWDVPLMRADALRTPVFGWGSHVSNSERGVLVALEAFGAQSTEELAERLGISRARDLERRQLTSLEEKGLVEMRDGKWDLPDDYAERSERMLHEPYTTGCRSWVDRRRTDEGPQGRTVASVEEDHGQTMSDVERDAARRATHAQERERYHDHRRQTMCDDARGDEECRELLNRWDEEREADRFIEEPEPELEPDGDVIRSEEEVFGLAREFFGITESEPVTEAAGGNLSSTVLMKASVCPGMLQGKFLIDKAKTGTRETQMLQCT